MHLDICTVDSLTYQILNVFSVVVAEVGYLQQTQQLQLSYVSGACDDVGAQYHCPG